MSMKIDELLARNEGLEMERQAELAKQSAGLRDSLEHGRAVFEAEILRRHREMRMRLSKCIGFVPFGDAEAYRKRIEEIDAGHIGKT